MFFQLSENLEQWPHLNELIQCYKADFMKDDGKYGRYESVAPPSFQNQIFEGPDTDMETGNPAPPCDQISFLCLLIIYIFCFVIELELCNARHPKPEESNVDDMPSTSSGRQIYESVPSASSSKRVSACLLDLCLTCMFTILM